MEEFVKSPTDPDFASDLRLRRKTHRLQDALGDITRQLYGSYILNAILAVALLLSDLALLHVLVGPRDVLIDSDGYMMGFKTDHYGITNKRAFAFFDYVYSRLYNMEPGDYDLTPLLPYLDQHVAEAFYKNAQASSADRVAHSERQFFHLREIRRYPGHDDRHKNYLIVAVRGELEFIRPLTADSLSAPGPARPDSEAVCLLVYLTQKKPNIDNSWGLEVQGQDNFDPNKPDDMEQFNKVWDQSGDFTKTKDTKGNQIQ